MSESAKIVVVGVGGAGNSAIERLGGLNLQGAKTIAIDCDKPALEFINANKKLSIGELVHELGCGGFPELGEKCAESKRSDIIYTFDNADIVLMTVGLGGGTGTGAAPVIAQYARESGALVVAFVTIPLVTERGRTVRAVEGLERLRRWANTVVILDPNKIARQNPFGGTAFSTIDVLISETIRSFVETLNTPTLTNMDYASAKAVLANGGLGAILYGSSSTRDPMDVIYELLNHPLLDADYENVTGAIICISAGEDLPIKTAHQVMSRLRHELDPDAKVAFGVVTRSELVQKIQITAIVVGITTTVLPLVPVVKKSPVIVSSSAGKREDEIENEIKVEEKVEDKVEKEEKKEIVGKVAESYGAIAKDKVSKEHEGLVSKEYADEEVTIESVDESKVENGIAIEEENGDVLARLEERVSKIEEKVADIQMLLADQSLQVERFMGAVVAIDPDTRKIVAVGMTQEEANEKAKRIKAKQYITKHVRELLLLGVEFVPQ